MQGFVGMFLSCEKLSKVKAIRRITKVIFIIKVFCPAKCLFANWPLTFSGLVFGQPPKAACRKAVREQSIFYSITPTFCTSIAWNQTRVIGSCNVIFIFPSNIHLFQYLPKWSGWYYILVLFYYIQVSFCFCLSNQMHNLMR